MQWNAFRGAIAALLLTAICGALTSLGFSAEPLRPLSVDTAPTFRASDLLVAEVLRGPNYELDEFVQVEQSKYCFKIRTEWGMISAHGLPMLELKLREIHAVEHVRKRAKDPQLVAGVVSLVKNSPHGMKSLLSEPDGTSSATAATSAKMVRFRVDPVDRRAGDEIRRRMAIEVGCDPETGHPILKGLLDGLAVRSEGEPLAANPTAPATVLPGLSLLALNPEIRELVASKPPHELHVSIERELESLEIPEQIRAQFCEEANYTTQERLLFLYHLRQLRGVKNLHVMVEGALEAKNQADALAVIQELKLLGEVHQRDPILEVADVSIPIASTKGGKHVLISCVDYVMCTRDLVDVIAAHRRDFPKTPSAFYSAGRVSPTAKKTLAAAMIDIIER